jgi:hypothetical protein
MRTRILVSTLAVLVVFSAASAANAGAPPLKTTAAVFSLPDFAPIAGASSTIVRTDGGARFSLSTSGLPGGHAITLWLIIFNEPGNCATPNACDLGDIDPASPAVVTVTFGAGRVVGPSGQANYAGHIAVGNLNRPSALPDEMQRLFGPGLTDARGADFLLVVHDHTELEPGRIAEQIHSFGVGCPGDDGFACVDPQASYNSHLAS